MYRSLNGVEQTQYIKFDSNSLLTKITIPSEFIESNTQKFKFSKFYTSQSNIYIRKQMCINFTDFNNLSRYKVDNNFLKMPTFLMKC